MSATAVRQCPGWWASLVQAECDDCGWVGPTRDLNQARARTLVQLDVREHQCWKEQA